ncbi:uncharacterized protein A1O9_02910 [Exophiala aquamarina CBS 119918]|uniref:Major facilitator superfamily (MFS) profile domain-containing protein n=1 Tax=Exophiala aquamarina CBS 119918 TaxID=1182545 RepID=A0A072PMQ0_9EURO|nr:uncharacterized protein A1O9_02910 [Exophiala aquamarina CBS 119918]KEF61344.1 hypothetical protein A1O9_02910 [Exophiala aquamarina CBS 119918]
MLGIFFEGFRTKISIQSGNVYLPTQVAILYESRTIMVGFNFGISWIAYFFSALAAAAYCYRYKKLRVVVVCGFTCFMIFNICMATTQLRSGKAIWAYPIFFGLGLALCLSALVSFAQFSAPPDIIIIASALVSTFRGVGATIGTATFAALFEAKFTKLMPERIAAAVIPLGLPESSLLPLIGDLVGGETEQLATVKGATPEIIHAAVKGLKIAYIDSFRFVWIMAAVLSAVAGAVSLLFKDYKEDFNLKIDAPAESEEALYGDIVHKEKV